MEFLYFFSSFANARACFCNWRIISIEYNLQEYFIFLLNKYEETNETRNIILDYNKKDKLTMERLSEAIRKINLLEAIGPHGKRMVFSIKSI